MSRVVLHRSNSRGISSNGWIYTKHSFCFADYYDRDRINFGVLRAINDMVIAPGHGLTKHPHSDIEIVMLTMKGSIFHSDSLGNKLELKVGSVQTITSGRGYSHEEINKSDTESMKFLHIWIFPSKKGLQPNYSYKQFDIAEGSNKFQLLASPHPEDGVTLIQQNAWVYITNLEGDQKVEYSLKVKGYGVYIFVVKGMIETEGYNLKDEDGIGIWDTERIAIKAEKDSQIILIEVPLNAFE